MAKLELAPLVSLVTGGFGDMIFQKRRGVNVAQRKGQSLAPRSEGQRIAANRFVNGGNISQSLPQFAMRFWGTIPRKPRETMRSLVISRFTQRVLPRATINDFAFVQGRYNIDYRFVLHANFNFDNWLVGSIPPINPPGFEFTSFMFISLPAFDPDIVSDVGELSTYLVEETHFNHVWGDFPIGPTLIGASGRFRSLADGNEYLAGWTQGIYVPGETFNSHYLRG